MDKEAVEIANALGHIADAIADAVTRSVDAIEDARKVRALFGYIGLDAVLALHEIREECIRHLNGKDEGESAPLHERLMAIIGERVPWLDEVMR